MSEPVNPCKRCMALGTGPPFEGPHDKACPYAGDGEKVQTLNSEHEATAIMVYTGCTEHEGQYVTECSMCGPYGVAATPKQSMIAGRAHLQDVHGATDIKETP